MDVVLIGGEDGLMNPYGSVAVLYAHEDPETCVLESGEHDSKLIRENLEKLADALRSSVSKQLANAQGRAFSRLGGDLKKIHAKGASFIEERTRIAADKALARELHGLEF